MDSQTIAIILTAVISVLGVVGLGIAVKYFKLIKEALDVAGTAVGMLVDGQVSQAEIEQLKKEWQEFKDAIPKKNK